MVEPRVGMVHSTFLYAVYPWIYGLSMDEDTWWLQHGKKNICNNELNIWLSMFIRRNLVNSGGIIYERFVIV